MTESFWGACFSCASLACNPQWIQAIVQHQDIGLRLRSLFVVGWDAAIALTVQPRMLRFMIFDLQACQGCSELMGTRRIASSVLRAFVMFCHLDPGWLPQGNISAYALLAKLDKVPGQWTG